MVRLEILKLSSTEYLYKQHSLVAPPKKQIRYLTYCKIWSQSPILFLCDSHGKAQTKTKRKQSQDDNSPGKKLNNNCCFLFLSFNSNWQATLRCITATSCTDWIRNSSRIRVLSRTLTAPYPPSPDPLQHFPNIYRHVYCLRLICIYFTYTEYVPSLHFLLNFHLYGFFFNL